MVTCIGASVLARPVSVRVSHAGSVRDLASDAQTQTLYSGGDDGTVRRWSVRPASLLAEYQVSHNPVTQVAVHPQRPLFAALATDGRRSHILHIWDVERGQEVGRRYLDEEPLFVRYSPTGSYLVYATADFRSVHVLDGNRGRPLPYLRSPLGLVNYLLFSSSETTVVAYAPGSGTFNYLNLRTGEEARTVKSLRDLQYLSVLSDRKRNAVAKSGDLLVVVDIYTGEEKDSRFLPGIQSITVDPASGTIAVVSRVEDRIDFSTWQFRDGALARRFLNLRDLDVDLTKLAYHEGQIVSGHADGSIYQYSRYGGSRRLVADYPLAKIHDFEVTEGRMHLSLPEEILTITSDLFTRSPQDRIGYVFTRRADNPFSAEVGLEPLHTGEVIAWTDDGRQAAFTFLDTQDEVFDEFETPLLKLRGFPGTILALERSGALKRIDPASLQVEFEFSAVGIQTMVETDAYGIVAGKNAAGIIDTALIRIDPRTGETVGVPTDPFFVYDLQVGEGPRELFSIGLERRAGSTNTVVSRHSGRNLERTNTIMLYPGEDLRAGLYVDPETYDVYTTAGYEGVKIWDGRRIRQFEAPGSIPRAVRSFGSYVFAINRDATLTVWDKRSGEYLLRFYVFADGEWIAVTSEGYYAQSENADAQSYLALTDEAARGRTLEDYRISPPFVLP
jgi:hypothetical protein